MLNEIILIVFYFIILLYSIIIHEVAHGFIAMKQGDNTAKYAGRLTLNPISHIDLIGSIVVPFLMYFSFGFAFGWAKPVPYNPYNLKNQRWGSAIVAIAGPLANIVLALLATIAASLIDIPLSQKQDIILNFNNWSQISLSISQSFGAISFELLTIFIVVNSFLAFFNLIPIPPLDGSKIIFAIFSIRDQIIATLEQFGFFLLILIMFVPIFRSILVFGFYFFLNIFLRLII